MNSSKSGHTPPAPPTQHAWTPAEDQQIRQTVKTQGYPFPKGLSAELRQALNVTKDQLRNRVLRLGLAASSVCNKPEGASPQAQPTGDSFSTDEEGDSSRLVCISPRIKTAEEALFRANIDLKIWEIERSVVNNWEMGCMMDNGRVAVTPLHQVKVWLKKKQGPSLEEVKLELIAAIKGHTPKYPKLQRPALQQCDDRLLYELSIPDLHLGKLAWAPETGENYDMKIARELYLKAVEDLVRRGRGLPIEQVATVIGSDFFHTDNHLNTTTAGTPQDVDGRWQKCFSAGIKLLVEGLELMRELAPVKAIVIPGNHDANRCVYMGSTLSAWFRHCPDITIDNRPSSRKYLQHGVVGLGFTHGSEEKAADLPLIMAQEAPEMWSRTKHREWHTGHLHKRRETHYTAGDTFTGVVVRISPSLARSDSWHHKKGYVKGVRAAEAYLWGHATGYVGHFSHTPMEQLDQLEKLGA